MVTSMKSTHESVPFKYSVVRLYNIFMLNTVYMVLTWGNNPKRPCCLGSIKQRKQFQVTHCGEHRDAPPSRCPEVPDLLPSLNSEYLQII